MNRTPDSDAPKIVLIEAATIKPNPYNPNRMSKQQMDEMRAEVDHLGELPQPIYVRPVDDGHEVVDGEHRLAVAQEKGLTHVPCRVVEVDDFEARRRCYKLNRGSTDNRVLLGRMFQEMIERQTHKKKKSIRQLAKDIHVAESTIRNHLKYVKAANVRTRCAPDTADADIAKLKLAQVRYYLGLPEPIRDRWLDAEADITAFEGFREWVPCQVEGEIRRWRLSEYLPTSRWSFHAAAMRLAGICHWCEEHCVEAVEEYLPPVAEFALPAYFLDLLPLQQGEVSCRVLITPDAWRDALLQATKAGQDREGMWAMVQSAVRVALRKAGHDPADVCGPEVAEALQIVASGRTLSVTQRS